MRIVLAAYAGPAFVLSTMGEAGHVKIRDCVAMAGVECDVRAISRHGRLTVPGPFEAKEHLGQTVGEDPLGLLDEPQAKMRHHCVVEGFGPSQIICAKRHMVDH